MTGGHAGPDSQAAPGSEEEPGANRWIGRPLVRREDPDLVQGRGRYAGSLRPRGLIHLAIRRAGMPRGSQLRVEVASALELPGVLGAWTADQLGLADPFLTEPPLADPAAVLKPPVPRPVMAREAVRFEGDAVAAVAAETPYQAYDAAQAIEVDLAPDRESGEPVGSQTLGFGDLEAAFDSAPVVVRQHLAMGRICGAALEPRAVMADWRAKEGKLFIHASVAWVHGLRDAVARCLGLEPDRVVAIAEDVGGSFGAKNLPYPEYVIAAAVSRILERPVRWIASRTDDGWTTGQAHAADLDVEVAAEQDGRLRGLRARVEWPIGAYVTRGSMQDRNIASHMISAYRLPALEVRTFKRDSISAPAAYIRGGGRPVGNFAVERILDRLARRLGLDPIEVRRRNLIPPQAMPYETGFPRVVYDGGDFPRLLDLAAERIQVGEIRARQARGELVGVGFAMCVEATGFGQPETSRVVVRPDGRAVVIVGSTPHGQGHRTFAAQVVAERLGWPLEMVEVQAGDSRHIPWAAVTAASRSAVEVGNSVALSAAAARRRLLEMASERFEAASSDIVIGPQGAQVRGVPGRRLALADLVGEGLEVTEAWDSQGAPAWSSSCNAAVVRIDPDTGAVEMGRYVIAHDSGRPINPMIVEGQIHGGYAHGVGYALFEEAFYSEEGFCLTPSFLNYAIVSPPELAREPELIHIETPSSQNPEGFRGVGEAGTIAVPAAVANAVEDALYAFGREVCVDAVPITPLRLWDLIQKTPG